MLFPLFFLKKKKNRKDGESKRYIQKESNLLQEGEMIVNLYGSIHGNQIQAGGPGKERKN